MSAARARDGLRAALAERLLFEEDRRRQERPEALDPKIPGAFRHAAQCTREGPTLQRPRHVTLRPAVNRLELLDRIQKKVLWLGTYMVHHANALRPNADGLKVGGHQASSSSIVSLLTALYFDALRPDDLVAVKAHASPAFYAIQYLRGRLTAEALRELRTFGGLQAYPSRRKNADIVDLSTGSMGLGAVQATFRALASRYVADHFGGEPKRARHRHRRGRRARRGERGRGAGRGGRRPAVQRPLDRGREPSVARPHRARRAAAPDAGDVRSGRMARQRAQVGAKASGRLRHAWWREAPRAPARDDEHGVPASSPPAARRRAQGARGEGRGWNRPDARPAALRHERRRARRARRRRRRSRSPAARRGTRRGREGERPALGHLRQHHQGLEASAGRRSAQSHDAPHAEPDRRAAGDARYPRRPRVGRVRAGQRGSQARAAAAAALHRAGTERRRGSRFPPSSTRATRRSARARRRSVACSAR